MSRQSFGGFVATAIGSLGLVLSLLQGSANAGTWDDGRPMESARVQVQAAAVSGEVYVAGGVSILGPQDDFEVYDPIADHWRSLPALPQGRELFGMAALGTDIYVVGGVVKDTGLRSTSDAWVFDTQRGQWRRGVALPEARSGLVIGSVNGTLYAIGGRGKGADRVLRLDGDSWVATGNALSPARQGHAVAVNGTKIYVLGGQTIDGKLLSRVDFFDTATGKWSAGPKLPKALTAATATFIGADLHLAGGMIPAKRKTLSDHYVLASGGGQWAKEASLPTARQGLASAAINNQWFVIGGGSGSGAYTVFTASDAVDVYRP